VEAVDFPVLKVAIVFNEGARIWNHAVMLINLKE